MRRVYLPLILLVLLVLEGVAIEVLPPSILEGELIFVPHWVLVFLLFVSVFYDRNATYHAILYALIFGFLIDVVYTGILGVYTFSYGIATYIVHELKKLLHGNFYVMVLLGLVGVALADVALYIIFSMIEMIHLSWQSYSLYRLLPSLGANLLFLLIFYPIVKNRLVFWAKER